MERTAALLKYPSKFYFWFLAEGSPDRETEELPLQPLLERFRVQGQPDETHEEERRVPGGHQLC